MASFWPTMRLRRVDLPALGFPATVTIPAFGIWQFSNFCILRRAVRAAKKRGATFSSDAS
jgi:hypothetical protein